MTGWRTSDDDEIQLRRWRGYTEIHAVTPAKPDQTCFGTFRAESASGNNYLVEVRSFDAFVNSCGCIDHRVNGLGTCKHIEGVLATLRRSRRRHLRTEAKGGSPYVEIYLDRRTGVPAVLWPTWQSKDAITRVHDWLRPWLDRDNMLTASPRRIERLLAALAQAPHRIRKAIRVSQHLASWLDRSHRDQSRVKARAAFERRLERGQATLDVVKHQLLPYQRLGALHLAFSERALLADDMGLGKTVQAIAACELLARMKKVHRVLIVCPASLKAEWEEQIAKFGKHASLLVFGSQAQRLLAYGSPAFYTIVNYEQVLVDADEINRVLGPDVVILDEAQRIKNWQTKTARRVKSLISRYAFVLTGTPIENRIDELYSIIQYLDPEVLGPLFRFNREFYRLDERGRPIDYQNLADLRRRVMPLMLRRRKSDVEKQLPARSVKNYFVPMTDEQRLRYEDYRISAARLVAQAQRRPLTPAEFERLQRLFACMRMVCDTPAILDPSCRVSPKLEEIERILGDFLEEPDRKVIVFSEWERMLLMVRELATELGLETAWHSGSLPQQRRRAEIKRFKHDPACRLFLSTDSGSVGLNLQVASAVINVDLPWNPAKLEQRIARAWRKNQMRPVNVVNLVTENSIEHGILHLLGRKQALAEGVLDGAGDLASLKMPSGRGAFIERVGQMLAASTGLKPRADSPEEVFVLDLVRRHGNAILSVEARRGADGTMRLLAVVDLDRKAIAAEIRRLDQQAEFAVEIVDRATWTAMCRLADSGVLQFTHDARVLHRSAANPVGPPAERSHGCAEDALHQAWRSLRMAKVLAAGGFPEEVSSILVKALRTIGSVLMDARGGTSAGESVASDSEIRTLVERNSLPPEALVILDAARSTGSAAPGEIASLLSTADRMLATVGGQATRFGQ